MANDTNRDVVLRAKPKPKPIRRIRCGGGYRIVRKTIPAS